MGGACRWDVRVGTQVVCNTNKFKQYSLHDINALLDQMFPPVEAKAADVLDNEIYNSWNFWKPAMPEVDIDE
jgi:phosphatidate phosphatase PAH1